MIKSFCRYKILFFGLLAMGSAHGMESTKILPKGVRSINIKSVNTSVDQKTDSIGLFHPIAEPLAKEFTFRKVIEGEKNPTNKMLLQSFLQGKFNENDSLGTFSADMKGNIAVTAAVVSYGLTDRFTLALAVPYYQAKMNVKVGFRATDNAQRFVNYLNEPGNNQTSKAREVADKLSNAVRELNTKLLDNGYSEIQDFDKSGIGDITAAGKLLILENGPFRLANATGVMAPTGYSGDPNILVNVPFGTGAWQTFTTFYTDEYLMSDLWLNQYVKYTYQLPSHKNVRLKTEDESIVVSEDRVGFRLGSRWETGVSAQYEPWYGLIAGLGMSFTSKYGDRYETSDLASRETLEKDTFEQGTYWEARLGYQSVPAFKRGEFPVPFAVSLEAKRHIRSVNTVIKDLYTADFSLFF